MAARQPSKQTKTKAEAQADTGVTNQPVGNRKREPEARRFAGGQCELC